MNTYTIYILAGCQIIGVFMYVLATNPKAQEVGRIMFFCGLLAVLLYFSRMS
jgi:Na+/phosphate symporter